MDNIKQENNNQTSSNSPNIVRTEEGKGKPSNESNPPKRFFKVENLIIIFTGLIFVVTSIYTVFSYLQWQTMKDALDRADTSNVLTKQGILSSDSSTKEALRISDSSLAIAKNSLVLTSQNIKIIRDNARTELRAYIQADSVYFYKLKVGEDVLVALRIANAGKTPAYNVKIIPIIRTNFMTIYDTLFASFIQGNSHFVDLIVVDSTKLTEADSIKMFTGEKPVGFNVKIFFTDVFGKSDSVDVCRFFDIRIKKFVLCENHQEHQYPK